MNLISRPQTYCLHLLHDKNFHINIRTDHMVHGWYNGLTSLEKKTKSNPKKNREFMVLKNSFRLYIKAAYNQ